MSHPYSIALAYIQGVPAAAQEFATTGDAVAFGRASTPLSFRVWRRSSSALGPRSEVVAWWDAETQRLRYFPLPDDGRLEP